MAHIVSGSVLLFDLALTLYPRHTPWSRHQARKNNVTHDPTSI